MDYFACFYLSKLQNVNDLDAAGVAVEVGLCGVGEVHDAFLECEEGMVAADANILASQDASTALAHNNGACLGSLFVIQLGAQILWV